MSSVNTGLSITRALELKGRSQKWLALSIGMALDMRVSEFFALGETSNDKS